MVLVFYFIFLRHMPLRNKRLGLFFTPTKTTTTKLSFSIFSTRIQRYNVQCGHPTRKLKILARRSNQQQNFLLLSAALLFNFAPQFHDRLKKYKT